MRLIDADALVEKKWDVPFETKDAHFVQVIDVGDVEEAPTIDPETLRPTGRWVYDDGNLEWACSECLRAAHVNLGAISGYILSDYCPNCGAKMEG